jgi:hypothetical protein
MDALKMVDEKQKKEKNLTNRALPWQGVLKNR